MLAVVVHADVVLVGISIPAHRMLEVVEEPVDPGTDAARTTLSPGEARALVDAGHADPVEPDFDELSNLIDDWQRA